MAEELGHHVTVEEGRRCANQVFEDNAGRFFVFAPETAQGPLCPVQYVFTFYRNRVLNSRP